MWKYVIAAVAFFAMSPTTHELRADFLSFEQPKTAPSGPDTRSTDASPFAQGEAAARKGDHPSAITFYDQAIAADPKAGKPHAYKTLSLMALKRFDEAQREIDQAIALDAKDYTFVEIAGQLKIAQGQVTEGKTKYDQAAALSPKDAGSIYTDLAAALAARNDDKLVDDIDKSLKKAADANPPSAPALFALGQSYVNAGRHEGKKFLQRYIEVATALPKEQRDERKIKLARQLIRAIDAVKGT